MNVFDDSQLTYLCQRQEVLDAYQRLPNDDSQVSFTMSVPDDIKQSLLTVLGLDVSTLDQIPFRWVRGDTPPHIDRGRSSFENTYLVYLTDGEGVFRIGETLYPMTAGTGFIFLQGTSHEVTDTNGTTRLILGPMSETGFSVGATTSISANGATETLYLQQTGSDYFYRINNGDPVQTYFPLLISNTNDTPASNLLKVIFTTDLTFTGNFGYIEMRTNGIQIGDTAVQNDGTKATITIDGVTDYNGFIINDGRNDTYVYNLHIAAVNGSTLAAGEGWIGRQGYGKDGTNNFIIGCSSDGDISFSGGGIVGIDAARQLAGGNPTLTIVGCSSSGSIGQFAGGIVGSSAASGSGATVTIEKCSSSGTTIETNGGGIVGAQAGVGGGSCFVGKCYSTGTIGVQAGGICGYQAGMSGGFVYVNDSYSRGNIQATGGGIYGAGAAVISGAANATNCYSSGSLTTSGTGIFGSGSEGSPPSACYVANGSWSTSAANAAMGTSDFITVVANQPFELRDIGPSPYSLTTVVGEDMSFTFSASVAAGSSSTAAVLAGISSFSIVEIDGESPLETPSITINSTTGVISTTSETFVGTFQIVVRAVTNPYSITRFTLTVTEAPPPTPPTPSTQLPVPIGFKRLDYSEYGNLVFGNRLVIERLSNVNLRFNSYADYLKYKIARATINTK